MNGGEILSSVNAESSAKRTIIVLVGGHINHGTALHEDATVTMCAVRTLPCDAFRKVEVVTLLFGEQAYLDLHRHLRRKSLQGYLDVF